MEINARWMVTTLLMAAAVSACDDEMMAPEVPRDPDTADRVMIDRFSDDTGMLFTRSASPGLPGPGEAIDFDEAPFITQGLGPDGQVVRYYNFDVMPTTPAPIWVLFREGSSTPVPGQLNIIDVVPGDGGYNDFWQVVRVTVPQDYVANTATSFADLQAAGFEMEGTTTIVNCPVVPEGSVAREGPGANGLIRGWYRDQLVFYFDFNEAPLMSANGVPASPIHVAFNINPDDAGGGPPSGFMTQGSSAQTHNVVATVPGDAGYSPLWNVFPYDNEHFDMVHDLESAQDAPDFGLAANVNCPVVFVGVPPGDPETSAKAVIDRFSDTAGTLFVRSSNASLPAAGEPIDFDQGPFITQGLGPNGGVVRYYNFDVMPEAPAPIYVFFFEDGSAVPGQNNVVGVVPGEPGYSDFWRVTRVTVPDDYIANTITSEDDLLASGFDIDATDTAVNCPIVPDGSTASIRVGGGDTGLVTGWHDGQVVLYFHFGEAPLEVNAAGNTPTSPIFVTFNINPDQTGGGPPSGFLTEQGTNQTHNVLATLPGDPGYSPLWSVIPYDNASFGQVLDLASAQAAPNFGVAARVNCPVVFVQ
jgi:hypothetical protein